MVNEPRREPAQQPWAVREPAPSAGVVAVAASPAVSPSPPAAFPPPPAAFPQPSATLPPQVTAFPPPLPFPQPATFPSPATFPPSATGLPRSSTTGDLKESPPLTRPRQDRMLGGVSVGIAGHLRVPVVWVRVLFCLLSLLSGIGVLAYALLWIFVPQGDSPVAKPRPASPTERRQAFGVAAIGAALAILGYAFGFGQTIGWLIGPLGLAAVGGAFIWREADDARREKWRRSAAGFVRPTSGTFWRIAGGAILVIGGLGVFALGQLDFTAASGAIVAVALTLVGVAIIAIPWWVRLVRDLSTERRELVVQQERAEIAAHLHDSVLQTLALIQRQAADPREVLRLSRSQERELRSWLYGPAGYASNTEAPGATGTLAAALAIAAGEVEDTYAIKLTPVVVGDTPMDPGMGALVAAAREAMVNAAKHAGTDEISLYAEVEESAVTVFVRDRGAGFDVAQVGADRRGLAESIRGRMDRHHGRATVRSTPGEGTEVELEMPIMGSSAGSSYPAAAGGSRPPAPDQQ